MTPPPLLPAKKNRIRGWQIVLIIVGGFLLISYLAEREDKNETAVTGQKVAARENAVEEDVRQHKVSIGMTDEEALRAWGRPYEVNPTTLRDSSVHEQWVYAAPNGHNYLYFENGVLTAIQGNPYRPWAEAAPPSARPMAPSTTVEQELKRRAEVLRRAGIDSEKE